MIFFMLSHTKILGEILRDNFSDSLLFLFRYAVFDNVQNDRTFVGNKFGGVFDIFDKIRICLFVVFDAVWSNYIVIAGNPAKS